MSQKRPDTTITPKSKDPRGSGKRKGLFTRKNKKQRTKRREIAGQDEHRRPPQHREQQGRRHHTQTTKTKSKYLAITVSHKDFKLYKRINKLKLTIPLRQCYKKILILIWKYLYLIILSNSYPIYSQLFNWMWDWSYTIFKNILKTHSVETCAPN